jgi:hypothetical protein
VDVLIADVNDDAIGDILAIGADEHAYVQLACGVRGSFNFTFGIPPLTITATTGTGGTISPSGTLPTGIGGTRVFHTSANAGFQIADVVVDGASQGPVSGYTFTNVTVNHTISATYDAETAVVVTKLESFPIDGGVQLKWTLANAAQTFQSIHLERSDNETGPWQAVAADVTQDGDQTVAVDRTAAAGQSYWYRLMGTTAQGQQASLGSVHGTAGAPHEFALRAAWPNPTRGSLTTEFSVARTSHINLAVHDLQGRVMQTLAKGVYAPGRYQVKWDGRTDHGAVPAGMYFLRMTTEEGQTFTNRIVVGAQ